MSNAYRITDQSEVYFVTFTVVDWIDVFIKKKYFEIITDSLIFCRKNKGLNIHAYVIMSNHFHGIFSSSQNSLAYTIRDFKSYTASSIIKLIKDENSIRSKWILRNFRHNAFKNQRGHDHQFWMRRNHAKTCESSKFTMEKLNYIHNNPVKAGYVLKPEHWIYSSAQNYMNNTGVLEIDLFDY